MSEETDLESYAELREAASGRAHRLPVAADYEEAGRIVDDCKKDHLSGSPSEWVALIALAMAAEREIAIELSMHAVETEIMLLITLGEIPTRELLETFRTRLCDRIRNVAFPPGTVSERTERT